MVGLGVDFDFDFDFDFLLFDDLLDLLELPAKAKVISDNNITNRMMNGDNIML